MQCLRETEEASSAADGLQRYAKARWAAHMQLVQRELRPIGHAPVSVVTEPLESLNDVLHPFACECAIERDADVGLEQDPGFILVRVLVEFL